MQFIEIKCGGTSIRAATFFLAKPRKVDPHESCNASKSRTKSLTIAGTKSDRRQLVRAMDGFNPHSKPDMIVHRTLFGEMPKELSGS